MFAYKEINSNTESIDNLEHLKNLIEQNLNNINVNSNIEKSLLRKIQDRIYTKYKKLNNVVFRFSLFL